MREYPATFMREEASFFHVLAHYSGYRKMRAGTYIFRIEYIN
jgi:hypothetical protein